jgi:hypothetical protein
MHFPLKRYSQDRRPSNPDPGRASDRLRRHHAVAGSDLPRVFTSFLSALSERTWRPKLPEDRFCEPLPPYSILLPI